MEERNRREHTIESQRDEGPTGDSRSFHSSLEELCRLLRVLSEEKRLRIIHLLKDGEVCVCDLMERMDISQSLLSHHLGVLRKVGLVRDRRDGQWVYYSLNVDKLEELNEKCGQWLTVDKARALRPARECEERHRGKRRYP